MSSFHIIYHCTYTVIIRCQQLTHLTNGEVSVSIGTLGVNLGVGAVATYSCSNGYGLVGQVTRTCVSDGGSSGIWSGSEPTCEGLSSVYQARIEYFNETLSSDNGSFV